jgi:APA family basic amino acid/polyamine antiporter
VTTITAGTILGSAIFVAAAFVPREVPHPALVMLLWIGGGLIAIAGALTYAELGTMFPEAGGQYHYLKQAFGPLWGFLFGWTSLLAIQAGPVAYLGVAFGEYLGVFVPFFSSGSAIASVPLGPWTWEPNTAQLAGVAAIALLAVVNYFGAKEGARVQGILTDSSALAWLPLRTSRSIGPHRCQRGTCWRRWGWPWWRCSAASTGGTRQRCLPVRSVVPIVTCRWE